MKNITKTIAAFAVALTMASCSVSGPILITDNPGGKEAKRGEASYNVILGFIRPMNADISIKKAAKLKVVFLRLLTVQLLLVSNHLTLNKLKSYPNSKRVWMALFFIIFPFSIQFFCQESSIVHYQRREKIDQVILPNDKYNSADFIEFISYFIGVPSDFPFLPFKLL